MATRPTPKQRLIAHLVQRHGAAAYEQRPRTLAELERLHARAHEVEGTWTEDDVYSFTVLFDVADELDGGLTLGDLDARAIEEARRAAARFGLSWPPWLAECEEFALDHHRELRHG